MQTAIEARPVHKIARDMLVCWKPKIYFGAVPYLKAMLMLDKISDDYGADSGESVVRYFLSNAMTFKGEDARRIKAELNAMLKAPRK